MTSRRKTKKKEKLKAKKAASSNEIMQFAGALTGMYDGFDLKKERNSW
jgi:hypothetical protein